MIKNTFPTLVVLTQVTMMDSKQKKLMTMTFDCDLTLLEARRTIDLNFKLHSSGLDKKIGVAMGSKTDTKLWLWSPVFGVNV